MSKPFKVRDRRNRGWFYLDNETIDLISKNLGIAPMVIYATLCRHADNEQRCFPSQELLAKELGISQRTVIRHTKTLIDHNIIFKNREYKGRNWANNEYILMDKTVWQIDQSDKLSPSTKVTKTTDQSDKWSKTKVTQSHTKDTHRTRPMNNTHIVADATREFSFGSELEKLKSSPRKDMKIIALYWKRKNYQFANRVQFSRALKRELRPANSLIGYDGKEIALAMSYCEDNYGKKQIPWTLETVSKRIADLINTQ